MATKHMNAAPGDFAETVLMPGDPLRAQYIADTYLEGANRVTDVRNMWGFTGEYKGQAVSVMAHGMGIPSASIYCSELMSDYGVSSEQLERCEVLPVAVARLLDLDPATPRAGLVNCVQDTGTAIADDPKQVRVPGGACEPARLFDFRILQRAQFFIRRRCLSGGRANMTASQENEQENEQEIGSHTDDPSDCRTLRQKIPATNRASI